MKDMVGVLTGFVDHVDGPAHLVLAGPAVTGVSDDPEGEEVWDETRATWSRLPTAARSRVHLAAIPMADPVENALVVNSLVFRNEPDLEVGDEIILKIEGRETPFQIVGVATGGAPIPTMFANYPYFARVAHTVGRAEWVFTATEQHDMAYQAQIAQAMENRFEQLGMDVGLSSKSAEEVAETTAIFEVIIVLLLIMAFLLAVIGGLGLMGTMSINVLERTREIGVMRAIGASNRSVRRIFIVEGIIIGVMSWLVGTMLAYPLSKLLSDLIGRQFLNAPLVYTFSLTGVFIWLALVVVLAALASFLPAWNASRLTVREVLAYE
jgi:putative ABC transport system permease protein